MKKMLKAVAAAMAVTAMMCVNAYAANENYLKEEWNDGIETVVEKKAEGGDTVYRATNVINPYSSPVIPVLLHFSRKRNETRVTSLFRYRNICQCFLPALTLARYLCK